MTNPIPKYNLFGTPTMADLQAGIEALSPKERALVWRYVMMTINACHALVEENIQEKA